MDELPLIGRDSELERAGRLLAGEARGVVIDGPRGVGKTRLAYEILALARRRGYCTAEVRGRASDPERPLAALAPLLGDAGDGPHDPFAVLVRARAAVSRLRQDRPLALLIDDAHLLDEVSAVLTEQLVAHGEAFVIATLESGEPAPDPVIALWKNGLADRLEIDGLGPSSMAELAVAILGGPIDPGTVRRLVDLAGPRVGSLRALIASAYEGNALRSIGGSWALVGEIPLPAPLTARVETQLRAEEESQREILDLVAVAGRVELAAVDAIGGPGALEALERLPALTAERDGQRMHVRISDPLVGEIVRRRMLAGRQRALKRALGGWVLATGCQRPGDHSRATLWRLEGAVAVTPQELLVAAREARDLGSFAAARQLVGPVLEGAGGFEAELLAAELEWLGGDAQMAHESLRRLATTGLNEGQRVATALRCMEVLSVGLGRRTDALAVAGDVAISVRDPALADQLALAQAEVLLVGGEVNACLRIAQPLLTRHGSVPPARVAETVGQALVHAGRPDDALALVDRVGDPGGSSPTIRSTTTSVLAVAVAGRLGQAEERARAEHARAVTRGDRVSEGLLASTLASVYLLQGRASEAARLSRRAQDIASEAGRAADEHLATGQLVLALALSGEPEAARMVLAGTDIGGATTSVMARGKAWLAVAEGDLHQAVALLREVVAHAAGTGDTLMETLALYDLARLGLSVDTAERLMALKETTSAVVIHVAGMHASALAQDDARLLGHVSQQLEAMGAWLWAAEAAAQAGGTLKRRGEPRQAAALHRRAIALAQRCPGTVTPALSNLATRATLTARQIDIAGLAASGLSNKAIAERLYLSVRTVETQLQRIYEKLGVDGRSELLHVLLP